MTSRTRKNATDGKKAHNDNRFIKVGRVRMNSWMSEKLPAADIFISERELVHINQKHGKELAILGVSPYSYVTLIVSQCSEFGLIVKWRPENVSKCPNSQMET